MPKLLVLSLLSAIASVSLANDNSRVVPKAAGAKVAFDTYSGYFVSNKFEPKAPESYVFIQDEKAFGEVFGVGMVMRDKSHRLPKDAFDSLMVVAVIKRGKSLATFKVESVTVDQGVVQVRYQVTTQAPGTAEFACPLIISIPKGSYSAVVFMEGPKQVKKLAVKP